MKVHVFQHVPFEDLAGIEPWMVRHGHSVAYTRWWTNDTIPDVKSIDWLIVMGGPMGVYEEATHPWLAKEKHGIATAIGAGKKVLGICLGAQMIAEVLGARVYPHRHKEIGWHPVILTPDGIRSPWFRNFKGDEFTAFQWHGDTFDLPAGSIFLARGEACEHQAFSYGEHVLAMQFHIGSTAESIEKLIVHCREDLLPGPYVQPIHEIRNPPSGAYEDLKSSLSAVLEAFGEEVRVR